MKSGIQKHPLWLLPPMILYVAAGSLLVLTVVGVVVYLGVRSLSRKPDAKLRFLLSAAQIQSHA